MRPFMTVGSRIVSQVVGEKGMSMRHVSCFVPIHVGGEHCL